MEAPYTPSMEQQSFLFYNPGPHPQGPHGHYTPHPHQQPYHPPVHFHPEMMKPVSQQMHFHQPSMPHHAMAHQAFAFHHGAYPSQMLTPVASPQPVYPKPSIIIETQTPHYYHPETDSGPSTPPLSSSNSSVGSPTPSSALPTPANERENYGFPNGMMMGFRQGCERESLTLLGNCDGMASPPLRPGMCFALL